MNCGQKASFALGSTSLGLDCFLQVSVGSKSTNTFPNLQRNGTCPAHGATPWVKANARERVKATSHQSRSVNDAMRTPCQTQLRKQIAESWRKT